MPAQDFAAFRTLVFEDETLEARLFEERDREAFFALAVTLGAERGLRFEVDDVRRAYAEGMTAWLSLSRFR